MSAKKIPKEQKARTINAFKTQEWNGIKSAVSWVILKVMREFVQGFEKRLMIEPCVTIVGSDRSQPDNKYYKIAEEVAMKRVKHGYGVINGGGQDIMEARNKGVNAQNGKSVGFNIDLPFEQSNNIYINRDKSIDFDYIFVRMDMFIKCSQGFIVLLGGFGIMDELLKALTLIQTPINRSFSDCVSRKEILVWFDRPAEVNYTRNGGKH